MTITKLFVIALLSASLLACGEDVPECKRVIQSCTETCDITCDDGTELACVGPEYGDYPIGMNERCCICVGPDA